MIHFISLFRCSIYCFVPPLTIMCTLSGSPKLGRMNREEYSPPLDVEMRGMTNGCEPSVSTFNTRILDLRAVAHSDSILKGHQHSSSLHSSSGLPQGPRQVFGQVPSGEDVESSSNKVCFPPEAEHERTADLTVIEAKVRASAGRILGKQTIPVGANTGKALPPRSFRDGLRGR